MLAAASWLEGDGDEREDAGMLLRHDPDRVTPDNAASLEATQALLGRGSGQPNGACKPDEAFAGITLERGKKQAVLFVERHGRMQVLGGTGRQ